MKESASLRYFFTIFFKYKTSILSIWSATVLTILLGNQLVSPTFEAESSIMVNFGREYLYNPEVGSKTPYNYYNRSGLINSEIEILSSRDLLEQVVRTMSASQLYPKNGAETFSFISPLLNYFVNFFGSSTNKKIADISKEDRELFIAVEEFRENLTILGNKESNIIRVIFQHTDPRIASETINILIDLYQKKHLRLFRDQRVSDFLENRVGLYDTELQSAEKALEDYRKSRAANSIELQEEILIRQRGQFDTILKEKQSELQGLSKRLASLTEQKGFMSESTPLFSETTERDRVIDNTKAELLSLQLKEQELLGTLNPQSPQVINIRKRIEIVRDFLKEQEEKMQSTTRVGKSMVYQELERDIAMDTADQQALLATIATIKNKLEEIDASLLDYLAGEQKHSLLKRQKEIKQNNYLTYLEKLEEERINIEMDDQVLTNIKIVHRAIAPIEPVKPKKILNLFVGFLLGGFASISIAFFRNYVNQGINMPEDLEKRLNIPVLTTISERG